ncbi:MAG: alpha/beta fold hydrolase [Thermoleophilia bacterium]|nr:alpha/beta fold hydrolase [Thermoleophilia bacterium]
MPAALWYEVAGRGLPVVLLHAGIADSRMWDPQFASFAHEYRVVRFDARGFGRSPYAPGRFSPVDDVRELLDRLGIARAALVGASSGGAVALDVAIAYPERVWALVLVGATVRGRPWSAEVRRFQADEAEALAAGDLERAVELNLRLWVDGRRPPGTVPEALRARVAGMQRRAFDLERERAALEPAPEPVGPLWRTEPRLGEVRAPTLVVVGEADVADVHEASALLAERVAGARQAVIGGAAHLPSLERPQEFDRLVLDFLASAAPAGSDRH